MVRSDEPLSNRFHSHHFVFVDQDQLQFEIPKRQCRIGGNRVSEFFVGLVRENQSFNLVAIRDVLLDPAQIPRDLTHDHIRHSRFLELDDKDLAIRAFAEQIDNADIGRILPAYISGFVLKNRQPRFNERQIGSKKIFELPFKR